MVKMYGPAFDKEGSATGKLVERDVPENDISAYAAVGYKQGSLPDSAQEEAGKAAEEKAAEPTKKPAIKK